ncbi:hypothetical protein BofuT4_uP019540.1 [Botrytis cinerea T4]|uniref:Uncharacterized protein n=1 Tax=Botryotinia fuckeliana (strain T4) TaxID=999810 RepID=G2YIW1_BOTF4|nr:hypothetical protein BofuT4_uP019540.1 [Botrytis cinerea T4]
MISSPNSDRYSSAPAPSQNTYPGIHLPSSNPTPCEATNFPLPQKAKMPYTPHHNVLISSPPSLRI